ncbi:MAG: hypothetical protein WBX38_07800 [Candidatus Sulfotelmatobacter sp.]
MLPSKARAWEITESLLMARPFAGARPSANASTWRSSFVLAHSGHFGL